MTQPLRQLVICRTDRSNRKSVFAARPTATRQEKATTGQARGVDYQVCGHLTIAVKKPRQSSGLVDI